LLTSDAAAIQQKFLAWQASLEKRMGEPLSISGLTGPLRIFQRLRGHRHSIDDALTAWYALQKRPDAVKWEQTLSSKYSRNKVPLVRKSCRSGPSAEFQWIVPTNSAEEPEIRSRLHASDFFLVEVLNHGRVLFSFINPAFLELVIPL